MGCTKKRGRFLPALRLEVAELVLIFARSCGTSSENESEVKHSAKRHFYKCFRVMQAVRL